MKNCSLNATCGPESITRMVNTTAAIKVQKLISEFSSAAQLREPNAASSRPPVSGVSNSAMSCKSIILELLHVGDVQAVEGLAYLSLIHISEPTRLGMISYAVFCLKKKKK